MRCPKCQYISFDNGARCRNCGYEFSLTTDSQAIDLPIHTDEPIGPLADFALETTPRTDVKVADTLPPPPRPITSSFDLPLFKERKLSADAPRVVPPATPRPPLAVRRSAPTPPRAVPAAEEPLLGFANEEPSRPRAFAAAASTARPEEADVPVAASLIPRVSAALVDALVLVTIASIVLYLTLRICGLTWAHAAVIPLIPFVSFLLLIAGGYFTLFTAAGGQTIGKMAAGIRVVPMEVESARVPLGHSLMRAAGYAVSALPVGLGFLPALVGEEKRAVHDRLADTRVVKA
jgi:uncharacterized RDD family membrane protein YckC